MREVMTMKEIEKRFDKEWVTRWKIPFAQQNLNAFKSGKVACCIARDKSGMNFTRKQWNKARSFMPKQFAVFFTWATRRTDMVFVL